MQKGLIRHKTIPINFLNKINDRSGFRLRNFKEHGIVCVSCGLVGQYFAKERYKSNESKKLHINLYTIDQHGKERLMTRDHIIPLSKGGSNGLENSQTMCEKCNSKKGAN